MGRYLISRLFLTAFSLVLLVVLSIFLLQLLPGNPWSDEYNMSEALKSRLAQEYGWQGDVAQTTRKYISDLLTGRMGPSLQDPTKDASTVIFKAWSVTLGLAVPALILAVLSSLFIVIFSFGSPLYRVWRGFSYSVLSVPNIVLVPAVLVLNSQLQIFPVIYENTLKSAVLPIFFLALKPCIHLSNILLKAFEEVADMDFIRTAISVGADQKKLNRKWILKNALIPFLGYLPSLTTSLLTGSLFLEIIFNIQGMGQLFVSSLLDRDYFVLTGLILIFGSLLAGLQLLMDLLIYKSDPRLVVK